MAVLSSLLSVITAARHEVGPLRVRRRSISDRAPARLVMSIGSCGKHHGYVHKTARRASILCLLKIGRLQSGSGEFWFRRNIGEQDETAKSLDA